MSSTAHDQAGLTCRVIDNLDAWLPLRDAWDELLQVSPESTPWQGFDFVCNWWRSLAEKLQLRIFVVERNGAPCLILPLQISRWPWLPSVPVNILEPIGSIMDVNRPRFALGHPAEDAYDCALAAVWKCRDEWHTIRIDEKLSDDAEVRYLRQFAARHELLFRLSFSHLCPYLDLRQDWQRYLAGRSSKLRKNLRTARRRLEALGSVSLRSFQQGDDMGAALDLVIDLHSRSWKRKKKVEHSQSLRYQAFFRAWLLAMAERGRARILALYCGDRAVAATVAVMDETTYYSAQIVHDGGFAACSPGTQLEALELEGLMKQQRYQRYDFLGSFLNNKLRWTDTALSTSHVFVLQPALRTRLVSWYYFQLKPYIKPRLLGLLNRLRNRP